MKYSIIFNEYGDLPGFTGDITTDEAYAEYCRLFKTADGKWDNDKIYAARLAYVEANNLDPQKYNVRAWHLSSWQGPIPTPEPSPARTRNRGKPTPKSAEKIPALDFVGKRQSMTPWQRRRLVIASAGIGLAIRPPVKKGDS